MSDSKPAEGQAAAKKPLNLALIGSLVFAALNLGVIGAGAYFVYAATLGWTATQITEQQLSAQHEKDLKEGDQQAGALIYTMDKFTVNLSGDPLRDPKRTIQLEVNLDMMNKEGFEEVINSELRAKARDRIIQLLGNKSYSEVETIQGKLFLKDQIAMELNSILDKGVVKDVYFTHFVVQ
jgi:flagellar FliL protein